MAMGAGPQQKASAVTVDIDHLPAHLFHQRQCRHTARKGHDGVPDLRLLPSNLSRGAADKSSGTNRYRLKPRDRSIRQSEDVVSVVPHGLQ